MNKKRTMRIGLALGGGSARGWAHVGVIRALEKAGIKPDLVCGTSIGALVGAAYAAGELDRFEKWLLSLELSSIISFMDLNLNGGVIKGERLMKFIRQKFLDRPINELSMPFSVVATMLHNGTEVWLREGSTIDAVRASIALPGLFTPMQHEGRILVDGGLVNPVPVSLARAMGADIVIAVDLNSDMLLHHKPEVLKPSAPSTEFGGWIRKLQDKLKTFIPSRSNNEQPDLSMLDVMATSINIMQVRITRSRMAGDPPDIVIRPRLSQISLLDFHRAKEAIAEGKNAAEKELPRLLSLIKDFS